jgi:hypothetical protein
MEERNMPAAQPANTTISVFRRVRVYRDNRRHTSIKHLTTPFDDQLVAVPGEENEVLETRDTTFRSDAFRYGHPVTVLPRTRTTLASILAAVPDIKLSVLPCNPREVQIENTAGHQTDELYQEVAAAAAGGYHV